MRPLLLAAALFVAASCDTTTYVTKPDPLAGMPAASSPQALVNAFVWCNQNLSVEGYRQLFTDDFRFAFAALDTSGNPYRDDPWTRDDELDYFTNLVHRNAPGAPPARELVLSVGPVIVENDGRPGKQDPLRRKMMTLDVNLSLETIDSITHTVRGKITFFVVRGDSALIPRDLGRDPDPATWYIERWEDQTYGLGPPPNQSWGSLKARYR